MNIQQQQAKPMNQVTEKKETGIFPEGTVLFLAGIMMSLMFIGAYHWFWGKSANRFSVVDISAITMEMADEAKNAVSKEGISEEERKKVMQLYASKMNSLETSIKSLADECDCTLLVGAAVLSRKGLPDLTARLRQMTQNSTQQKKGK